MSNLHRITTHFKKHGSTQVSVHREYTRRVCGVLLDVGPDNIHKELFFRISKILHLALQQLYSWCLHAACGVLWVTVSGVSFTFRIPSAGSGYLSGGIKKTKVQKSKIVVI
jgi:hypothetical protein